MRPRSTSRVPGILPPGTCEGFGRAYLKSRSSDSFTAAVKDFIAPIPVNIANCGSLTIKKETVPDEDPNTTDFSFTHTVGTNSNPDVASPSRSRTTAASSSPNCRPATTR